MLPSTSTFCFSFLFLVVMAGELCGETLGRTGITVGTNDVQIAIAVSGAKTNEIQINHPFDLQFQIKNMSTNSAFIFYRNPTPDENPYFGFEVVYPSGKVVHPDTAPGFRLSLGAPYNLSPQQEIRFAFNLGYICKFDEVGRYKVTATIRMIQDVEAKPEEKRKSFPFVSSPMYVTVTR